MATDEPLDVDTLAASLRADAADLAEFAEILAGKLQAILPARTRIERRRDGLLGPKRITRIVVSLDDARMELTSQAGTVEARRAQVSGGIALKHERVDLDRWIEALSQELAGEARRSQQARLALQRLLI